MSCRYVHSHCRTLSRGRKASSLKRQCTTASKKNGTRVNGFAKPKRCLDDPIVKLQTKARSSLQRKRYQRLKSATRLLQQRVRDHSKKKKMSMPDTNERIWMKHDVFDKQLLKRLLLTPLSTGHSSRGAKEANLLDIINAAKKPNSRGHVSRFIDPDGVCPRERETRWDIKLTDTWISAMKKENEAFRNACEMIDSVKSSNHKCKKAKVEWHVMMVHPGSPAQDAHIDDAQSTRGGARCYYTFILPLTSNPKGGGTHFPQQNVVFSSFGGALLFDGAVLHAGLANESKEDRVFLYAAIFTGKDHNC